MRNPFKKYNLKITWIVDDNTCTPFTFDSLREAINFIQNEMNGDMERLAYFITTEWRWLWEKE